MTDFPLQPPGQLFAQRSGEYRGFAVSSYQIASGGRVNHTVFYFSYVEVLLPTVMPSMMVDYGAQADFYSRGIQGGVSIGYPPFDRLFRVFGDHRFIRTAVTPTFVNWLMSIDWPAAARLIELRSSRIVFGDTTISTQVGTSIRAPQIQGVLNLLIDFLYQLPEGIWPTPLPAPVAGT